MPDDKATKQLKKEITAILQAEFGANILDDEPILQVALANTAVLDILTDKLSQQYNEKTGELLEQFSFMEEQNQAALDAFLAQSKKGQEEALAFQQKSLFDSAQTILGKHLVKVETLLREPPASAAPAASQTSVILPALGVMLGISNLVLLLWLCLML